MYKVMIIDDEPLAIEGLKIMLDWEKYGFLVSCEFLSASVAIKMIDKLKPDVIFTDICMQGMNGLDFVSKVHETINPNIEIVVISAYDDFEFAKRAMKLGVNHYILKPIMIDEVTRILLKIKDRLDFRKYHKHIEELSEKVYTGKLIEKMSRVDNEDEIFSQIKELTGNDFKYDKWRYLILSLLKSNRKGSFEEKEYFENSGIFENILSKYEDGCDSFYRISASDGKYGLVISEESLKSIETDIYTLLENMCRDIKEQVNNNYSVAVGKQVMELREIEESVRTAEKAFELKHIFGLNKTIFYEDIKDIEICKRDFEFALLDLIIEDAELLDKSKCIKHVSELLEYIKREKLCIGITKSYIINLVYRTIEILDIEDNSILIDDIIDVKENDIDAIFVWLKDYLYSVIDKIEDKKHNDYKIKKDIITYIEDNYMNNITLTKIASVVYMHPVYLGQWFKKSFDMNYQEYLHRIRIKHSKVMLRQTSDNLSSIAKNIGYSNYNDFLKYFERFENIKPKDYKESLDQKIDHNQ